MVLFTVVENSSFEKEEKRDYTVEEYLLARIRADDKQAFRELYRLHAKTIYAYAISVLKNHYDADEGEADDMDDEETSLIYKQPWYGNYSIKTESEKEAVKNNCLLLGTYRNLMICPF